MKKKESNIKLTKEEKEKAVEHLILYLEENLDIQISNLQSELLLDNITENIGKYYYNKAIVDSIAFMKEKADDLYLIMED